MRKLFFSFLILAAVDAAAQKKGGVPDTTKSYVPTGFRVGTDLILLGKSYAKYLRGWELNLDTDFWRYNFAVDYGFSANHFPLANKAGAVYSNSGHYVRVGADVNFLLKDPDRNRLFIGIRYARGRFGEGVAFADSVKGRGRFPDALYHYSLHNDKLQARWFELVTGISLKVWKGLWMGYTARMKFAAKVSGDGVFSTFEIPGYGLKTPSIYWGFNYQVFWRFSWKKTGALRPEQITPRPDWTP